MRNRPIEATRHVRVPFEHACAALLRDLSAVLGDGPTGGSGIMGDLSADLGHAGTMRQRVEIRVRSVRVAAGEASWELTWRAIDHPGLFPVFHGRLRLTPDADGSAVSLTGEYEPPLWVLGRFGDGLIGHRLARQSLEGYLARLASRMDRFEASELIASGR
jgi:hypothetical protein